MSNDGQLGNIVAWRMPNEVSLDDLRNALASAQLDPEMAGDLHPRYVLSRALRKMKKGHVIAKLQALDANKVSFQLTEQQVTGESAEYYKEGVVTMELDTWNLHSDNATIELQARDLVAAHTKKRLTGDLTKLVQRLYDGAKADLIPIREQGGAYFVPDEHTELVDKSRVLLHSIGGRLNSFAVRLGSEDTAASVADSMTEYLTGLIGEFKESCDKITSKSRDDAINNRMDRVAELKRKLECYRGILGAAADSIGAEIEASEAGLMAKLAAS